MKQFSAGTRLTEWVQFATDLAAMKARAGSLGLFLTMQAMDKATQAVGWEIAEKLDRKQAALANRYIASRESSRHGRSRT